MATKKTGIIVGIVAVAVIGIVAIFYTQRQPATTDATGAIGAAERYRAEQISDEDVILDIPGQEELAAAVFDVMTDAQKAELLGRVGETGRADLSARFENAGELARMNDEQLGRYVQSLDREAQERVANALRIDAEDIGRMNAETLGRALARMNVEARAAAIGRYDATQALARMNEEQLGHFTQSLDREAQERVASALRIDAEDIGRLDAEVLGRALARMNTEARTAAVGRYDATQALARMNDEQLGHFTQSLDRAVQERVASALRIDAADIGRMNAAVLGRALASIDAEARTEAIGRFDASEAMARMNDMQLGSFLQSLDRATQERVVGNLRFAAEDIGRMNAAVVGRALSRMDAGARAEAIGRFDASEAMARMNDMQLGSFAQSLDRATQERVASGLRFEAEDIGRLNADVLGRALARMDVEARAAAVGRFEATEAYLQRMDLGQKAALADALGAKAFERAILQAKTWNDLSRAQQWTAWTNLGRQGQEATLRYAGVTADLERTDALQRDMAFERAYEQGRAADHGAAARD